MSKYPHIKLGHYPFAGLFVAKALLLLIRRLPVFRRGGMALWQERREIGSFWPKTRLAHEANRG
jgi:hypothetical protein